MEKVAGSEGSVHVIKNIHVIMMVVYCCGFIFSVFGSFLTLYSSMREQFIVASVMSGVLLAGHTYAWFVWDSKFDAAKKVSALLSIALILAFPIGTIFGVIMLYHVNKCDEAK